MVTAIAAAVLAAVAVALLAVAAFVAQRRSQRRFTAALERVDSHMEAVTKALAGAVDRLGGRGNAGAGGPMLTLGFEELLDVLVSEAASKTGAEAAAVRVEGPSGKPVTASVGAGADVALLETVPAPSVARPYRAATIDWTFAPVEEAGGVYRSALVVPVIEDGEVTGAVAAFAAPSGAFRPEHLRALQTLVADAAPGLANARRFARAEAHSLVDPATGLRNPRGYEIELEREVARARRTGRPLSLVVLDVDDAPEGALLELARLLGRAARATDILCRRRETQIAVVLPETREAGASRFASRLREEARATLVLAGPKTFASGLVEWRPSEAVDALDSRVSRALGRPSAAAATVDEKPPANQPPATPNGERVLASVHDARAAILETLADRVADARRRDTPLSLLVLDVDGFAAMAERLGPEGAEAVLDDLARRLRESAGSGAVRRLGPDEFVVILAEATVNDAEGLLGTFQASLNEHPPHPSARVTVSAGITGLSDGDDARNALGRAEQALWQAKQSGHGTVVVAMTSSSAPR